MKLALKYHSLPVPESPTKAHRTKPPSRNETCGNICWDNASGQIPADKSLWFGQTFLKLKIHNLPSFLAEFPAARGVLTFRCGYEVTFFPALVSEAKNVYRGHTIRAGCGKHTDKHVPSGVSSFSPWGRSSVFARGLAMYPPVWADIN